jgi:HAD superfamily hydrolase (TIGR01509 family)
MCPPLSLLNAYILSADFHLRKPDPAFFQIAFDRFNLNPERMLFVDDNSENIASIGKLGANTFLFEIDGVNNHDVLRAQLIEQYGINL